MKKPNNYGPRRAREAREIKAQKAMARRPKRARPTAAKRLQQNNALAVAYGGSQEAVDVAARALRAAEAAARERLDAALQVYDGTARDAPEIEVDLAWWELMDARQRRSLGRQLADTVAKCRRALKPTIVTLSSYTNEAKAHLEAIGSAKWPVIRDARDTWKRRRERTARVVYLTPDADEALEGLEDGVTYVVAGLVDRPVRKNCTRDAANLHGCEVKRLPLREEFRGRGAEAAARGHPERGRRRAHFVEVPGQRRRLGRGVASGAPGRESDAAPIAAPAQDQGPS